MPYTTSAENISTTVVKEDVGRIRGPLVEVSFHCGSTRATLQPVAVLTILVTVRVYSLQPAPTGSSIGVQTEACIRRSASPDRP